MPKTWWEQLRCTARVNDWKRASAIIEQTYTLIIASPAWLVSYIKGKVVGSPPYSDFGDVSSMSFLTLEIDMWYTDICSNLSQTEQGAFAFILLPFKSLGSTFLKIKKFNANTYFISYSKLSLQAPSRW